MGCTDNINFKLFKIVSNKDEKKQTYYNPKIITDNILSDILEGKMTLKDFKENPIFDKSVEDKVNAFASPISSNPYGDIIGKITDGYKLRELTIAIHHLLSDAKSQQDLVSKYKINPENLELIKGINDGKNVVYNSSYLNIARLIGADILRSMGYRFVGKTDSGLTSVLKREIAVGKFAISELEKQLKSTGHSDYLSIKDNGKIINRKFKNNNGSFFDETDDGKSPSLIDVKTIALKNIIPERKKGENSRDYSRKVSRIGAVRKAFTSLMLPSNKSKPSTEAPPINEAMQDVIITPEAAKVMEDVQASNARFHPYFVDVLDGLFKDIEDFRGKNKTGKSALEDFALFFSDNNNKTSKYLFGTVDIKELMDYANTDSATKEHIAGQSSSKILQIMRLYDDWETLRANNLHWSYQQAIQMRLHTIESTADFQGGKFMVRPSLGSSYEQVVASPKERAYLTASVQDQLIGVSFEQILGIEPHPMIDRMIKIIDANNAKEDSYGNLASVSDALDKGMHIEKTGSAWNALNLILAIKDIREGMINKEGIKTYHLPEPDGTASGATITLMQNIGRSPEALETFKKIFNSKEYKDVYDIATKKISELEAKGTPEQISNLNKIKQTNHNMFNSIKDLSNIVGGNVRDLIKLPFTKLVYGQNRFNNIHETAKELAQEIIDNDRQDLMHKYLGTNYDKNDMENNRRLLIEDFSNPDTKNGKAIGHIIDIIDKNFSNTYQDMTQKLGNMHDLMAEILKNDYIDYDSIRIIPAFNWIKSKVDLNDNNNYANSRDSLSTSIDKWQEIARQVGNEPRDFVTIKKKLPNKNSIFVLLQHMTDSAAMFLSMEKLKDSGVDFGKEPMLWLHDAGKTSVKTAMILEEHYPEALREVNMKYDFVEAAVAELKYARSKIADIPANKDLIERVDKSISDAELNLKEDIKNKQESLKNADLSSVFGLTNKAKSEAEEAIAKYKVSEVGKVTEFSSESNKVTLDNIFKDKQPAVSYDIETTGLGKDALIYEIGYKNINDKNGSGGTIRIKIPEDIEITSEVIQALKVSKRIPKNATEEDVKSFIKEWNKKAIPMNEALVKFNNITSGKHILGYNSKGFDDQIINREQNKYNTGITTRTAIDLFKEYQNGDKYKIGKLTELIPADKNAKQHTAKYDAKKTVDLAKVMATKGNLIIPYFNNKVIDKFAKTVGIDKSLFGADKVSRALGALSSIALKINKDVKFENGDYYNYDIQKNTITYPKNPSIENITHELIHAATSNAIENNTKYKNSLNLLYAKFLSDDNVPQDIKDTFENYGENKLHEFISQGISNDKFRNILISIKTGKESLLHRVGQVFLNILGLNKDKNLYTDLLHHFIKVKDVNHTPPDNGGKKLSFTNVFEDKYKQHTPKDMNRKGNVFDHVANTMDKADSFVYSKAEHYIDVTQKYVLDKLGAEKMHHKLMKESEVYRDTFNHLNGVWEDNALVNHIKNFVNPPEHFRQLLQPILSQASIAQEYKNKMESKSLTDLTLYSKGLFDKDERSKLYSILNEAPIFHLMKGSDNILSSILDGSKSIESSIKEILDNSNLSGGFKSSANRIAKSLAKLYIDKEVGDFTSSNKYSEEMKDTIDKLSALYSLQKIENSEDILHKMVSTDKHKLYSNKLFELINASKNIDNEIYNSIKMDVDKRNDNLNYMTADGKIQTDIVTLNSINSKLKQDLGWKVLRHPTERNLGIIYRDISDAGYQAGVGTGTKIESTFNPVVSRKALIGSLKDNNAIFLENSGEARIILRNDELETLGLHKNIDLSVTKSYSDRTAILQTQAIRDKLVNNFTYDYSKELNNKILNDIKEDKHLWYIKLPKDMSIDQLPEKIQKKYIASRASTDIGTFTKEITLIRNDIIDFVEGYGELKIGETNTTFNKMFNVLKKSVLLQKIHWVLVNPAKIAMDNVSNVSLLLTKNLPASFILKSYREDSKQFRSLMKLREDIIQADIKNRVEGTPESQSNLDFLEDSLKKHPLATAYYNGFIQSISLDLTRSDNHTTTGLHKDINNLLNKLFKNNKGELRKASKHIFQLTKKGVNIEDLLVRLSNKVGDRDSSQIAETLGQMADHIREIKNSDDVSSYVQEFLGTPGSSMVAVGSLLTQMSDFLARNALMKYHIERGVHDWNKKNSRVIPDKELDDIKRNAIDDSLNSFIDYRVNMPKEFRLLEQLGVTSFISYWSRIQMIIARTGEQHPINSLLNIIFANYVFANAGNANIFGGTLNQKQNMGGLFHAPSPSMAIVLPTKLFNF